eukprot:TRINITY_DN63973_c0_g1_i1.p1 TRINITY_DN63973_c0_g1~~TRINITY_DN63973_c0_g1_i1.p1  ORF type:complete len:286 (-),score=29.59 TRINITY_DN63973_c0_g1_i1:149-1006(-)
MMNEHGQLVDLYIPRKCSATNALIAAKDHASVQLNIGNIDANGKYIQGDYITLAFSGSARKMGTTDQAINRRMVQENVIKLTRAEREEKAKREGHDKKKKNPADRQGKNVLMITTIEREEQDPNEKEERRARLLANVTPADDDLLQLRQASIRPSLGVSICFKPHLSKVQLQAIVDPLIDDARVALRPHFAEGTFISVQESASNSYLLLGCACILKPSEENHTQSHVEKAANIWLLEWVKSHLSVVENFSYQNTTGCAAIDQFATNIHANADQIISALQAQPMDG